MISSSSAGRRPCAGYFEFGPFALDIATRSLYRGDVFIPVTPKALDTLFVLVEDAGRLVAKQELMQRVWPDTYVDEGSLANNISMLRKLLNPSFGGFGPIATVARRGYRFVAPVHLRDHLGSADHVGSGFSRTVEASYSVGDRFNTFARLHWLPPPCC